MARHDAEYKALEYFQGIAINIATGGKSKYEDYEEARGQLLSRPLLLRHLPEWIVTHRWGSQYWAFIKKTSPTYQGRRDFIYSSLNPVFEIADHGPTNPVDASLVDLFDSFSSGSVAEAWVRAYARCQGDPEGAITSARTLIEATCKYLLDELNIPYTEKTDLPTLYKSVARAMKLSPEEHNEQVFKKILSGCTSVVGGLAELRNAYGDAHGRGIRYPKPNQRHAEMAVNLAGTIAVFLIQTYEERIKAT
jgi:hypothetical protein